MLKGRGFTMIEILTTITILGIVATISVPEYWRMRDRDTYRSQGQALFDTILSVRNSALTNKVCTNGNISVQWTVTIDANRTSNPAYRVQCIDNLAQVVEEESVVIMDKSEIEFIDFNGGENPPIFRRTNPSPNGLPDDVLISFFSGSASGRLEYKVVSVVGLNKEESIQMVIGHDTTGYQHTICFNRVAGFPSFNKSGNTCQTY